ncbi:unnamed protein product, partial [Iphiclides podalirius]
MHSDHDEGSIIKRKQDKTDTPSDTVTVRIENPESSADKKTDSADPKPRIVLTFRSEKTGAKSSNMKIVSTEEKHEEISPRRSNRNKSIKWESDEDNDTQVSSKTDINVSQSMSENDEASDSSHATLKRSTGRRSKEFSENVLANAIARKEKSYETIPGPTQRLSRRIKPTAKILANEELRMGLESQNNARLGIQTEKSLEEGVRTRRSAHTKNYEAGNDNTMVDKKAVKRHRPMQEEVKPEAAESSASDMKVKHLCKLGLKAISNVSNDEQSQENDNRSIGDDEDQEAVEEDEEIDDDTEVINKLLEADEDSSDEDFYCTVSGNAGERPRRSTRLCSSYGIHESDQSSMSMGDDESKAAPRRSTRLRFSGSDFYDREAAEPEEGDEASFPTEQFPIIATCNCEMASNMYAAAEDLTEPVFCQAIETVDGVRVGCSHAAARVGGELQPLRRAGPRTPYILACRLHAAQLQRHMCCPACGLFCAQGIFYQCSVGHLFHLECGIPGAVERSGDVKQSPGCPHCGVHSTQWQPVNRDCGRVKIEMHCSGERVFLPEQREQSTPAYLSFSAIKPSLLEQGPLIPEDLLPSPPVDLTKLCEASIVEVGEMSLSKLEWLHEAIIAGETPEQLIPKIVAAKGEGLDTAMGLAASHGRVAALYLLHYSGAKLDSLDSEQRTPLLRALVALLDKPRKTEAPTKGTAETKTEEMDADDKEEADAEHDKEAEQDEEETEVMKKPSDEDYMKVIRYLIAAGCDVNLPGVEGMTPLHVAAQLGGREACQLLLDEGRAAVDARDMGGWTPLVWAAENSHSDVVRLLLERGADAAATDEEGNGVVHWCALHGDARSLRLLLDAAPHAHHAPNAHADTPLHVAARQGHYACVVILLARGARTDMENSEGELPVEVCTGQCQTAISINMQMALAVSERPSRCRLLSNDLSNGRETFPVTCVNETDDSPAPDDFTYVTSHVTPSPVPVDTSLATMQGCSCSGDCACGECACGALSVRTWYRDGRLPRNFPYHDPPMLFECNQTCACNSRRCGNRAVSRVQRGGSLGVRVQVFLSARRGWALRTLQPLRAGAPAALYCGELLSHAAADARSHDHYMFALDLKPDLLEECAIKQQLCVDAAAYGSAARFVNHSCRPNLAPVRVFTDTRDLRLPVVALFATRDIAPGEELTFDYGDKFWSVKSKWMKCECGTPECRYPTKSIDE